LNKLLLLIAVQQQPYPHRHEPIGTVRQIYDGVLSPDLAINTFRNIDRLFPSRIVPHAARPVPLPPAATPLRDVHFTAAGKAYDLDDYLELNRIAALLVLQDGRVQLERYRFGNTPRTRWMSMSVAKSITSTLVGAALRQGYIRSLSDSVTHYVPALRGTAYDGVQLRDVLMMASGVRWNETYTDPTSDRRRLLDAQISQQRGAALAVMKSLGRPLATYLSERIWQPFGMEADATWWLDSPNGTEIGGSGFTATLRLWWPGHDGGGAFMAMGIHGQYIYVNPAARVVIVAWGARPHPTEGQVIDDWVFCDAVTGALIGR